MAVRAQKARTRRTEPEQQSAAEEADVRNEALVGEVACCLAEIDEVLAEQESGQDKAKEEFEAIAAQPYSEEKEDLLRQWQAQYAHLGLGYQWCCGELVMTHENAG